MSSPSVINVEKVEEEKKENDQPHNYDQKKYKEIVKIINKEPTSFDDLARRVVCEARYIRKPMNLMNDSVLHEVIARRKTRLAVAIIYLPDALDQSILDHQNYYGDTPLHIAAMKGDGEVAKALLGKCPSLASKRNRKGETPLHKAALYGHLDVFNSIIDLAGKDRAKDRTGDGSTILHYAIMSDQPKQTLKIARRFSELIPSRNANGATPLQIMVAFFKKPSEIGIFESLLYKNFTFEKGICMKARKTDEESGRIENDNAGNWWSRLPGLLGKCPLVVIIQKLRIKIVKAGEEKLKYKRTLKLLKFLAEPHDEESFDFYFRGYTSTKGLVGPKRGAPAGDGEIPIPDLPAEGNTTGNVSSNTSDPAASADSATDGKEKTLLRSLADELVSSMMSRAGSANEASGIAKMQELVKSASRVLEEVAGAKDRKLIWEESPLITGVKLGLDRFVIEILKVCPQSATYVGHDGMNVLQAAVKYDRRQVVKAIKEDDQLPSWLFTELESETKNTLLHIAATDKNFQKEADPLRLQDELEGFEMLEKIIPRELLNYRNDEKKTAREVFDDKHEKTLKDCRAELAEIGRACSPLVAAVVFTSSFYIPGENNRDINRLAFKIFSHVYVLAFSCAATSLVMFLLLVVTPFKQRDFRRTVPWHYLMACFLLAMSLAAFIVSFACNMYLQIYGEKRKSHADLATLLLELLVVPFLCALALFLSGASWRFGTLFGRLTK